MKTWITKLKAVWGRGLPVQLPALLLAAGGAFWLAYANPSGAFSMLAMLGAACLVFLTQLPMAAKYGWCALVLCVLLPLVGTQSSYFMDVATQVGMYVVLALGLNITVGYCGLFNLGYIAFYALGAYAYGLLCTNQCLNFLAAGGLFPLGGGSFWLFLLIGGAIGCLVGFLIALPVIRISGDYLCIVTLAFCEIIRNLLNNMIKPLNITNGAKGIANIPKPVVSGIKVVGANVIVTVKNTVPIVGYTLQAGSEVSNFAVPEGASSSAGSASDEINLVAPKKEGAQFFKVSTIK